MIPVVLFILTILYRWPDRATTVFDWDNIQYLLALERFDVLAHQPHPPGHPLFVFTGWIFRWIVGDGQLGLLLLSLLWYAAGTVWVYLLGRKLFDTRTGIGAAVFFLVSPLAGFFLAFPNTFSVEGALAAALWLVLADWIIGKPVDETSPVKSPMLLPWALGLLAGFRMSFLVFSLPAAGYAMIVRRGRKWLTMLILCAVAVLLWLVPLIVISGGIGRYLLACEAESAPFLRPFAIDNIKQNLDMFRKASFGALGYVAILPIVYGIGAGIRAAVNGKAVGDSANRKRLAILTVLWVVPASLFFVKNIMHPGYLFFFLPMASIGLARSLIWIARLFTANREPLASTLSGVLMVVVAISLMMNWSGERGEFFSRVSIRNSEARVQAFLNEMEENFPLDRTVIVSWEHFRQVQWYLPETYAVFPQAAYARDTGTDPERANLYLGHGLSQHPDAWHLKRSGPIEPILLPEDVEYVVVSPGDYRRLGNPEEFNVGETSAGEQYMWKRVYERIAIAIDGDLWFIATVHEQDDE